jgi:hypothetical protein
MSMLHGLVLVLPPGTLDVRHLPPALADVADPVPHGEGGVRWWDVAGLADGTLVQRHHPAGADLLQVTFSSNDLYRAPLEVFRTWNELLVRGARDLGARYGFVSRYPDSWDEPQLGGTLAALAVHDWDHLRAAPHEAWLFSAAERPDPMVGRHVLSGPWGAILSDPGRDAEPDHRILVPPPDWTVRFTNLRQQDPGDLGPDDDWFWFVEDISYYQHVSGVGVDIGWYPDQNPAGRYRVEHVDENWRAVSPSFETRSLAEVVAHVERIWRG